MTPITNETEYREALTKINELMRGNLKKGTAEGEELHALALIVSDYENKHFSLEIECDCSMISPEQIKERAARYAKKVRWSDEDNCYVGSLPDLCGDCCHGATPEEVAVQLTEIAEDWAEEDWKELLSREDFPNKSNL